MKPLLLTLVNPPESRFSLHLVVTVNLLLVLEMLLFRRVSTVVVNINNVTIGGTTGNFAFTAAPVDTPAIIMFELPVIIAPSISVPEPLQ